MMKHSALLCSLACVVGLTASVAAQNIEVKSPLIKLSRSVDLSAAESGIVREVLVTEGDLVEEGQLLVRMDAGESEAILQRVRVELDIAGMDAASDLNIRDAEHVLAYATAENQRALASVRDFPGSFTPSELEAKELEVHRAQIALERANLERQRLQATVQLKQRELELAELRVRRFNVYSELDGEVAHISHLAGEWVEQGDLLLRVVNAERLRVEGFLETTDYRPGLRGAMVVLEFSQEGTAQQTILGRLGYLSPENDPHNNEILVWAEFDNPERLIRPGMKPQMHIRVP